MQLGSDKHSKFKKDPEFVVFAQQLINVQQRNLGPRAFFNQISLRNKNVCFHGAILCFYVIAGITSFIMGIMGLAKLANDDPDDDRLNFNIFTYTLPFVAFILDHSTKRIKNIGEKNLFILLKLLIIVYYLGIYVLAL